MPREKKVQPKPKISANGHQLPDPIKAGEILSDVIKRKWQLGHSIGVGGFGEIYSASDDLTKAVGSDAKYVIKIEPHNNGPLFSEMHFYHRVAKPELIENWMQEKKLKFLGMPKFVASGSHEYRGTKYRFMVMERFGDDLQKLFIANGKKFSVKTVLTVGIKILDVLEYIHSLGYIHADIKGSNLLLGFDAKSRDNVYLVDFGLACRYVAADGKHKEYKPDPRKAHDGTIEFTSRDAHVGAHSRRGDLEILGYNLTQWLYGKLPWEDKLKNANTVKELKESYLDNIPKFMKDCYKTSTPCNALQQYFEYVVKLKFDEDPDYEHCRTLLRKGLRQTGCKDDGKLELSKETKRKRIVKNENDSQQTPMRASSRIIKKPCAPVQLNKVKRVSPKLSKIKAKSEEKLHEDENIISKPTPAMLLVMEKKRQQQVDTTKTTSTRPSRKLKRSSSEEIVTSPTKKKSNRKMSPRKYEISPELF